MVHFIENDIIKYLNKRQVNNMGIFEELDQVVNEFFSGIYVEKEGENND